VAQLTGQQALIAIPALQTAALLTMTLYLADIVDSQAIGPMVLLLIVAY
jgi:hypothetical protein